MNQFNHQYFYKGYKCEQKHFCYCRVFLSGLLYVLWKASYLSLLVNFFHCSRNYKK